MSTLLISAIKKLCNTGAGAIVQLAEGLQKMSHAALIVPSIYSLNALCR